MRSALVSCLLATVVGVLPAAADLQISEEERKLTVEQLLRARVQARYATGSEEKFVDEATERIESEPTLAVPAPGFSDRVNDSISDFLPMFQFAVNAVNTSDDDESVTVNFNPIRHGKFGILSFAATVTEPEPYESLLDAITDPAREAQKETLDDQTDDFDDITWSATYAYQRPALEQRWGKVRTMWGRDPALYKGLMEDVFGTAWRKSGESLRISARRELGNLVIDLSRQLTPEDADDPVNVYAMTLGELDDLIKDEELTGVDLQGFVDTIDEVAEGIAERYEAFDEFEIDALAELIENQPQLVGTFAIRDRDDLVGPQEKNLSVKLEWGRQSFNRLLKTYIARRPDPSKSYEAQLGNHLKAAISKVLADEGKLRDDKFVLSVTYVDRDAYSVDYAYEEQVTDPGTGALSTFARTASVIEGDSEEWCGTLQWSHAMLSQDVMIDGKLVHPRLDAAIEWINVENEEVRNDRLVGRLTYAYPISGNVTLPISFTYANDAEFLGGQDKEFSAHFGLSYKVKRSRKN